MRTGTTLSPLPCSGNFSLWVQSPNLRIQAVTHVREWPIRPGNGVRAELGEYLSRTSQMNGVSTPSHAVFIS